MVGLFAPATGVAPVSASSLVVPDDIPTIQGALNSLPDTVFVRSRVYSEVPVVFAHVALLGIPGDPAFERPVLAGLRFSPAFGDFPTFRVRGVQCGGPVYIQNDDVLSFIVLEQCLLLAGISDYSAYPATAGITLRGCRIEGDAFLKADGSCEIDSCIFVGSQLIVGQENCSLNVSNSEFHGNGTGFAISTVGLASDILSATVAGNVVAGYSGGIGLSAIFSILLDDNVVRDCAGGGIGAMADIVRLTQNRVERCGERTTFGVTAWGHDSLVLLENLIANCGGPGMLAGLDRHGIILGNIVCGNRGNGIHLYANPVPEVLEVKNNTSSFNSGNGFVSYCSVDVSGRYEFAGNIGSGNSGHGVFWGFPEVSAVHCNDWFDNGLGPVEGLPPSSEDLSTDPLFCNPAIGDFHLFAGSPLVDWPGCGRVGALGVGCSVTATLVSRFDAARVPEGVRIVWELGEAAAAALVWLERSEAGEQGPWSRPTTERAHDGQAEVELDRTAVADRSYWYRLVTRESGPSTVIGPAILVEALRGPSFRLALVGPSPSRGPVRIEFELRERAAIELDVFDVQGRLVASPARGVWPGGRHAVSWTGQAGGARLAGSVYLVRYRFPGGEDRRRVVRTP